MLNPEQIKNNWNEFRGGVRNIWGNLTEEEIDQTSGSLAALANLVQKNYNESREDIKHKLNQLLNSFDNDTDKGISPDESSYLREPKSTTDEI